MEDYIANLSLFQSLEPFKRFVEEGGSVGGGGGGWSRMILVLSLSFKLNNISIIQSSKDFHVVPTFGDQFRPFPDQFS